MDVFAQFLEKLLIIVEETIYEQQKVEKQRVDTILFSYYGHISKLVPACLRPSYNYKQCGVYSLLRLPKWERAKK